MNDAIREVDGLDLEPFMENALEVVVETIMLFGEFPQRHKVWRNGRFEDAPHNVEFDLYDFLAAKVSNDDRNEFMFAITTNYGKDSGTLLDWQKKIEKRLMEELAGSEMVREKALEMAEEEK